MSDPRNIPERERPLPGNPAWNEQALDDFERYIEREGEVEDDPDSTHRDAPGLRWGLEELVRRGRVEQARRIGRRVRYRVRPDRTPRGGRP